MIKFLNILTLLLVIIGSLNWLLVAFDFNLVTTIVGDDRMTKIVYVLFGLSAFWVLGNFKKIM